MAMSTDFPPNGGSSGLGGARAYTVLICDLIGLKIGADGQPDASEVEAYITERGGVFHHGGVADAGGLTMGTIHFFYQPHLSTTEELIDAAGAGQYDAVIAAATFLPPETVFPLGGVRIGAGTGNMGSRSWGGGSGEGGMAPLMNTPGVNSRATAQMVMKAVLKVLPDLPVGELNARVARGDFDTGRDLRNYPTEKLEGKSFGIVGYGNIGREVAKLARAFGMRVVIHARARHKKWIESEGFVFGETLTSTATGADVLSVHVGLGGFDAETGRYANAGLIGGDVLRALAPGAVLINYDRGELVDVDALEEALASGRVRHAAIDADLFKGAETGALSGPMEPYRRLVDRFATKLELLPHAAADTDHPSRVAGSKQAVDQIIDVITGKTVVNSKGAIPEGYRSGGNKTPLGIGPVTAQHLLTVLHDSGRSSELAALFKEQTRLWTHLAIASADERVAIMEEDGAALVLGINRLRLLIEAAGVSGPYHA